MCFGRVPRIGSEGCGCNYWLEDKATCTMGMLLPDETYEERSSSSRRSFCPSSLAEVDEVEAAKALAAFRKCDEFLKRHGIRPEFFCRHRDKLALQTWLLQRSASKFNSGEFILLFPNNFSILNKAHLIEIQRFIRVSVKASWLMRVKGTKVYKILKGVRKLS